MTAPESGPTLLAGREALELWFHEAFTVGNGCIHDPGLWSCKGWADALLASGVVRDVAGLAQDEALVERVAVESGLTRDDGYVWIERVDAIAETLTHLAAALGGAR